MKILYIYGYNSNKFSDTRRNLEELLGAGNQVDSVQYDQTNPKKAIEYLSQIASDYDCIIGSSLGGFYALKLTESVPVIVINPCMKPSVELPKLGCDIEVAKRYGELENYNRDGEVAEFTYGLFGTHDELFSYKDLYKKYYTYFDTFDSGHRPSIEELKSVIGNIKNKLDYWKSEECYNKFECCGILI